MSPPDFFSLPREMRDTIYAFHYHSQTVNERTIRPGAIPCNRSPTDDPIIFLINQFQQPICYTSKVVAAEYISYLMKKEFVRLEGPLPSLRSFLRSLCRTPVPRVKSIELDFRKTPRRACLYSRGTLLSEILPFFGFVVLATSIKAIAAPLHLPNSIRRRPEFKGEPAFAALRYSTSLAAHTVGLLVNGHVDEVHLVVNDEDTLGYFASLEDVKQFANTHWSTWHGVRSKGLQYLESEYNSNANHPIELVDFVVSRELQLDSSPEFKPILRIVLRRPQ